MTGFVIWICIAVFFIVVDFATIKLINMRIKHMRQSIPPNFGVILPHFAGRILPKYKVTPPTFTVSVDFEKIGSWGQEGILTFEAVSPEYRQDRVSLQAWRPDALTQGAFELAHKDVFLPEEWREKGYCPGKTERIGDEIIVIPRVRNGFDGFGWIVLFTLASLFSLTIAIVFLMASFI